MKRKRRYERRSGEVYVALEAQYGNENAGKSEGDGVIAPKNPPFFDMSENTVSVNELKEYQGQHEEGGIISPQNGSNIDLNVT